jgi:hypothetical protein
MAKRANHYESRIVLFLDFLGFKEIVERTMQNATPLNDLLAAIDRLHSIGRENSDLYRSPINVNFSPRLLTMSINSTRKPLARMPHDRGGAWQAVGSGFPS